VSPCTGGIAASTSPSVTATTGTFSAKIQRQETESTMTPPASGPTMSAIPPQAVQEPIAGPRTFEGKAATITASELGVSSAAAAPWSARATISASIVGARAHATDSTPKAVMPSEKTRRSP
jgi:hypothetical protein